MQVSFPSFRLYYNGMHFGLQARLHWFDWTQFDSIPDQIPRLQAQCRLDWIGFDPRLDSQGSGSLVSAGLIGLGLTPGLTPSLIAVSYIQDL